MTQVELPPYLRLDLTFYVTSDYTGLDGALKVSNSPTFPDPVDFEAGLEASIKAFNAELGVTDGRAMTTEEVDAYLKRKEED